MEKGRMNTVLKLLFSMLLCQVPAFIGAIFTATFVNGWYIQLAKPFFAPPNWVFEPVWEVLYLLMGVALFLVWNSVDNTLLQVKMSFAFSFQLILNSVWPVTFFGLKNLELSLVVMVFLLISLIIMYSYYRKINEIASALTIPYLVWVSYAMFLNIAIYALNKS